MLEGGTVPEHFAESRTVFIPKTSDIDDNGRIFSSPEALRPFDAVQLRLQASRYSYLSRPPRVNHEMHTSLAEMLSSRQTTDNIFEIETTALAHVVCAPQESGILLTDFVAAYSSVNHSWIFSVLERTELPEFIFRSLQRIYDDSTTHVEFAGTTRGQFPMTRGVKQGCPASGFLFAMAFDHIFRWLQEAGIPMAWISCSQPSVRTLTTSLWQPRPFGA